MSYWSPAAHSGEHILIIDDDVAELKVLLEALRGKGHRLSVALDGMQGYRRATTQQFALILLDVKMGTVDGFETCRLLKADPATANIPVIFLSCCVSSQERLMGLQTGAVDYITKPFYVDEVTARIEIHLALARHWKLAHQDAGAMVPASPTPPSKALSIVPSANHDSTLLRAAQKLVLSDLSNVPSLPELAAQLGTHEKRLTRVFQTYTGNTVYKFIRDARLQEAKRMLASSDMPIEEIAIALGFSSAANFSTAFRSYAGCTPSAFRRFGGQSEAAIASPRSEPPINSVNDHITSLR